MIHVENLTKVYHDSLRGPHVAVAGISFDVVAGQIYGLLGPQWSGQDHGVTNPQHNPSAHRRNRHRCRSRRGRFASASSPEHWLCFKQHGDL